MIYKIVILLTLITFLLYALRKLQRSPAAKALVLFLVLVLVTFASFPVLSTQLANLVGIGRGVDLFFYTAHLLTIIIAFHYYLKFKTLEDRLVRLARTMALDKTEERELSSK